MIKTLKKLTTVAGMAALCLNANALTLTQADIDILINDSNSNLSADDVEGYIPGIQQLTLAYKANVGGSDEGPFASSYNTSFSPAQDPINALIDYISGAVIAAEDIWLLVKDGNQGDPAKQFLFDISSWNGTDDISIENIFNKGSISHIQILTGSGDGGGNPGGTPRGLPDGGATAALLGLGVVGLAAIRRKRA